MARVLIAGSGYVGTALGLELARRGDTVLALRRRTALLPPGLHPLAADLGDPRTLDGLPSSLDAVVYAAGPASGDENAYEAIYGRGLTNLLAALAAGAAGGVRPTFVLLSSTSVYGQTGGEWVDESSATEPGDFRGRLVLGAEEALSASEMPGVVLRLGGIYGPGRVSLIAAVREGRARPSPGSPRYTNRIHRDDAVGALLHLLSLHAPGRELPAATTRAGEPGATARPSTAAYSAAGGQPAIYVGVDEEPADRNDVLRWLAERLGVEVLEGAASGFDRPAAVPLPATRSATSKRCSSARLRASGYRFRYPTFREGYNALLASPSLPIAIVPTLVK